MQKLNNRFEGQVTGTAMRRYRQKSSPVSGHSSGKECWRVVHEAGTIWQRVGVEEVVKSWLGGTGESNDDDWGRQVEWMCRGENRGGL